MCLLSSIGGNRWLLTLPPSSYAYFACGCHRCIFARCSLLRCCSSNRALTNKEQYKLLCTKPTDLPIFLQDWWLDAVCDNWDAAIVKNGDNISGVWPYPLEQKMGTSLLRT